MNHLGKILSEVILERKAQDEKWGTQNHIFRGGEDVLFNDISTSYRERRNYWRGVTDRRAALDQDRWDSIILEEVFEALAEENEQKARVELVQSAAVIISAIECIDRRAETLRTAQGGGSR